MKKISTLLSLIIALTLGARAQYHYLNYANAGHNPKSLNTDYDDDCYYLPDYTLLFQDTTGIPAWSPVAAIPFSFQFNGSPVSSFKVSTSGVLTFTTGAVAVPPTTNAALPSASIPDNSVCVWGLTCNHKYEYIFTKTFGTAPNRQMWVEFAAFGYPGLTGYNFWAIVLEEKTNNIYIVDQLTQVTGGTAKLAIGIQVDNATAYAVAGSPNVVSLNPKYSDVTDNSYYMFIPGVQPVTEVELSTLTIPRFAVVASDVFVRGTITNYGSAPITSFTIKYQSGANVYPYTKSSVNIALGKSYSFTHTTQFNIAGSTVYPLKVWVELSGDGDHTNDTLMGQVSGVSSKPVKNVVFEEATGTWCGWCPRGAVYMDSLAVLYPATTNLIAVHNADPMTVSVYDAGIKPFIPNGYPNGVVDRKITNTDPMYFLDSYNQQIAQIEPCEVNLASSYNATTKVLTIDVTGHFLTDLSGDYRFNAVVTEDNVHGTTSTWAQKNYYSVVWNNNNGYTPPGPLSGAGHDWAAESNPVAASKMYYDHVARAILGGFDGSAGSLPSTISSNGSYQHQYTYTVPSTYNISNLKVIAWVSDASTGEIFNSAKVNNVVGMNEEAGNMPQVFIYPNPSTGIINMRTAAMKSEVMKLNVMNSLGETVKTIDRLDIHNAVVDLSSFGNGLYFLQLTGADNTTSVTRVLINR